MHAIPHPNGTVSPLLSSDRAASPAATHGARPSLALSSGCLYTYGLARFFELARSAGAEQVEVIVDERWDTRQVDYLLRLSEQHQLPIVSLHAPFRHLREMAQDYLQCVRATLKLAARVGARVVVVHPEWSRQRVLAPQVARLARELQAATPITLAVENMPFRRLRTRPRYPSYSVESLARFEALTLDTTHLGTAEVELLPAYRALARRVRHVHLSDYKDGKEHLAPGDGVLPLADFLRALAGDGYAGIVVLELEPNAVRAGKSEPTVVSRLRRALDFCRHHLVEVVAVEA